MRKAAVAWMLAVLFVLPAAGQAAHKTKLKAKKAVAVQAVKAQEVAPAVPLPPLPELPKRPIELPAVAPTVSLSNGLLSIDAPNSRLFDVLSQVQKLTGCTIEGLSLTADERVVVKLGPMPPMQVLTQLLDGSRYNFMLLAAKDNSIAFSRLIITSRGGPAPAYIPPLASFNNQPPERDADDEGDADEPPAPADVNTPRTSPTPEEMLKQLQRQHHPNGVPSGQAGQPAQGSQSDTDQGQ